MNLERSKLNANNNVQLLIHRLQKSISESVESGAKILERGKSTILNNDGYALRAAANQFRQAAKDLDTLNGIYQTLYWADKK